MKRGKKIVLFTLLIAALTIIFFPVEKTANLDGYWSIGEIIIDGKEKPFQGRCQFYADKLDIYGEGDHFVTNMIEEASVRITKDSLDIISEEGNSFFTGKYRIALSKEIQNTQKREHFLVTLKLTAKNKVITFSRFDHINWNRGIPRGKP